MAAASDLLDLARRELGVSESPWGSNRVKYNTAYYGREVSGDSYPWCCVFLWWLFREAGASALFFGGGRTASCGALAGDATRRGLFVRDGYQPGDLVFLRFGGTAIRHVGIVERVAADGSLVTIEGNTGTDDDANGGQVQRRTRPLRYAAGAFRPQYEEETMTQRQFNDMMEVWLRQRAEEAPSDYSAQARAWAEAAGILFGDSQGRKQYRSFCTREQMMTFLYRFFQQEQTGAGERPHN